MKQTRLIMGMPITIEVNESPVEAIEVIEKVFAFFKSIDERFSPFKTTSEVSSFNRHEINIDNCSQDMHTILELSEQTKQETEGYFDIRRADGLINPSGLVKGWSIWRAAELLRQQGCLNYYVDAGGDVQVSGTNRQHKTWSLGIRHPFQPKQIVKKVWLTDQGMATSGTYERGWHIYNPHNHKPVKEIVSLTVIGPNIYEADRFATAAFAMGQKGIQFIETRVGLEGYMIDAAGLATMTSGFERYTIEP